MMDETTRRKVQLLDELTELIDRSPEGEDSPGEYGAEKPGGALVVEIGDSPAKPEISEKMCPHCGKPM